MILKKSLVVNNFKITFIIYFVEQATIDTTNREDVINLFVGQDRSVPCVANGYPPPHVLWVKSFGSGVAKTSDNDSSVLELNSVTVEDAGDYYCIASNTLVNPPGKVPTTYPWRITVNVAGMLNTYIKETI